VGPGTCGSRSGGGSGSSLPGSVPWRGRVGGGIASGDGSGSSSSTRDLSTSGSSSSWGPRLPSSGGGAQWRALHTSRPAARAGHPQALSEEGAAGAAGAGAAPGAGAGAGVDPFTIVVDEVQAVSERLRHSVVSHVPALKAAADYYFRPGVQGKRLRPTLLLLLASALGGGGGGEWAAPDLRPPHEPPAEPRRRAQRMAEIAETIHVASLLHDDVLDDASTRRGVLSLNASAGNKLAILAGDFLLARASVTLASLRNHEVTELMSRVLENLVAGEVMQMAAAGDQLTSMEHYQSKTFCKTASLMANGARCVALLADAPSPACGAAWEYGRHLGLAFQIVDDVLDITGSATVLGKPALNDMKAGLATAPVLLAAESQPGLLPLIRRKFKGAGDVGAAVDMVAAGRGVERARALAAEHAAAAAAQVPLLLPPGAGAHARLCGDALVSITQRVLTRSK
jgi:geranyl diphosphate synthase